MAERASQVDKKNSFIQLSEVPDPEVLKPKADQYLWLFCKMSFWALCIVHFISHFISHFIPL